MHRRRKLFTSMATNVRSPPTPEVTPRMRRSIRPDARSARLKEVVCVRRPDCRAGPNAAAPSQVGNATDRAASYNGRCRTALSAMPSHAAALTGLKELRAKRDREIKPCAASSPYSV
jgi:hypothetical protein